MAWLLDGLARIAQKHVYVGLRKTWKRAAQIKHLTCLSSYRRWQLTWVPPMAMIVECVLSRSHGEGGCGLQVCISARCHVPDVCEPALIERLQVIGAHGDARRVDGLPGVGLQLTEVIRARTGMSQGTAGGQVGFVGRLWRDLS